MKLKKIVLLTAFLIGSLFLSIVLHMKLKHRDRALKFGSGVNLFVTKIKKEKGSVLLNDSVSVYNQTPRIIKKTKTGSIILPILEDPRYMPIFGDLTKNYRIIKKSNNDT